MSQRERWPDVVESGPAEAEFSTLQTIIYQPMCASWVDGFPKISELAKAIEKAYKAGPDKEQLTAQVQEIAAAGRKARAK